jgi:7-cyano-7-deazaguanine reductase
LDDLNKQHGKKIAFPVSPEEDTLETILNKWPASDYTVELICEEFSCLCPLTNQPHFATIYIEYIPEVYLVDSSSLKLYLGSYRNLDISHEFVVNQICHDLGSLLCPRSLGVRGEFSVSNGIRIAATARWSV